MGYAHGHNHSKKMLSCASVNPPVDPVLEHKPRVLDWQYRKLQSCCRHEADEGRGLLIPPAAPAGLSCLKVPRHCQADTLNIPPMFALKPCFASSTSLRKGSRSNQVERTPHQLSSRPPPTTPPPPTPLRSCVHFREASALPCPIEVR